MGQDVGGQLGRVEHLQNLRIVHALEFVIAGATGKDVLEVLLAGVEVKAPKTSEPPPTPAPYTESMPLPLI